MSDYKVNLAQDWEDLKAEVSSIVSTNPNLTLSDLVEITGADYEDILWIIKTDR